MNKTIFSTGILLGFLAVLLGAFGAHGLEKLVGPESVDTFETGVRYQMYHALFLLILGIWNGPTTRQKKTVFLLVLVGVLLFSFSIYLLAINSLVAMDFKRIAFLTPIGGTLLLIGWFFLGFYTLTMKTFK
ncbi:DUF423 domain-containing protein [Flagellimonas aquimarina]|uniref:DUF423 domain-containing protein n=1 Tax=Flagellimonas aquimarina TaxID=2201895 RepID=A0A316L5L4_9FLAO|nr:DUF423 domain-containing protein [Allomuricauda koreensis]PWL40219.1 DUF423 domain-containing protein [Allomuricauda koreensis]